MAAISATVRRIPAGTATWSATSALECDLHQAERDEIPADGRGINTGPRFELPYPARRDAHDGPKLRRGDAFNDARGLQAERCPLKDFDRHALDDARRIATTEGQRLPGRTTPCGSVSCPPTFPRREKRRGGLSAHGAAHELRIETATEDLAHRPMAQVLLTLNLAGVCVDPLSAS